MIVSRAYFWLVCVAALPSFAAAEEWQNSPNEPVIVVSALRTPVADFGWAAFIGVSFCCRA